MKEGTKVIVIPDETDRIGSDPGDDFWAELKRQPDAVFTVKHAGYR